MVGHRALIIRTRDGHRPDIIGSVHIAGKQFYTVAELDSMRDQTLIPPGSKFDCKGRGKWGYHLCGAFEYKQPILLDNVKVLHRTRSWALIEMEGKGPDRE